MEKKSPHVTCPASPQTLYMGQICCFFLVGFLEVFATLAQERPKTHGKKKHVTCPASPQTLSMGQFFLCFFVFSGLLPPWPKNASKPMEKTKRINPCHLSSFSSDHLLSTSNRRCCSLARKRNRFYCYALLLRAKS